MILINYNNNNIAKRQTKQDINSLEYVRRNQDRFGFKYQFFKLRGTKQKCNDKKFPQ